MNRSNATSDSQRAAKKGEEIVVFITRRSGRCAECSTEFFDGSLIRVEDEKALCLDCADLGHLQFLPRGDAALTRRATKNSPLRATVVQWSRSRKRYERQGILASADAIREAGEACLVDADSRARRREQDSIKRTAAEAEYVMKVIDALHAQFPACPDDEIARIAEWTCEKHTRRVGRSAAAKELDPSTLRLAVVAHARHNHTDYDALLMQHGDRQHARLAVRDKIDLVLSNWERA